MVVVKYCLGSILLMFSIAAGAQIVQEDFTKTENQLENECWRFNDVNIHTGNHAGGGSHAHADAGVLIIFGNSPSLTTPFYYFDGNTDISFVHSFTGTAFLASVFASASLVDVAGNEIPFVWETNTFTNRSVTVNRTEVGYYRVRWRWGGFGLYANMDGCVDDFSTTAIPADPFWDNDTAVEGDQNVLYDPIDYSPQLYYDWRFNGPAGANTLTVLGNVRTAMVDWNTPGNYELVAEEYSDPGLNNCTGRETHIEVYVWPLPDVTVEWDSVCAGQSIVLDLDFMGTAPWQLEYHTGGGTQTVNFASTPATLTLPPDVSIFDITSLGDAGPGTRSDADYPPISLYYLPAPATGPIVHY